MLTCKEIACLMDSGVDLPFLWRMSLSVHHFMCEGCSRYSTHLEIMRKKFQKLFVKLTDVQEADVKRLEAEILSKILKPGR